MELNVKIHSVGTTQNVTDTFFKESLLLKLKKNINNTYYFK